MPTLAHNFEALLNRASELDNDAVGTLLTSQQDSLRRLLSARFDRRMAGRLDVEDIMQDVWVVAIVRFPEYVKDPGIPFPEWMRHVALDCLSRCHRTHIRTRKRSVRAEVRQNGMNGGPTYGALLNRALSAEKLPCTNCDSYELCERVAEFMKGLSQSDQTLLYMRIIKNDPAKAVATALHLTEAAVRVRQLRALDWLRQQLGTD